MIFLRKPPSKQEREGYRRWLENHQKTLHEPDKQERERRAQAFWKAQARRVELLSSLRGPRVEYKSGPSIEPVPHVPVPVEVSEELQRREAAARKIAEERRYQVAPICNKGGLQYITDPADFKTMGRKI